MTGIMNPIEAHYNTLLNNNELVNHYLQVSKHFLLIDNNMPPRDKSIVPLDMDFWKVLECKAAFMIKFVMKRRSKGLSSIWNNDGNNYELLIVFWLTILQNIKQKLIDFSTTDMYRAPETDEERNWALPMGFRVLPVRPYSFKVMTSIINSNMRPNDAGLSKYDIHKLSQTCDQMVGSRDMVFCNVDYLSF
jgi:hypothetical protein